MIQTTMALVPDLSGKKSPGVCPVTGLSVRESPEWVYSTPDRHYSGKIYMVGSKVVVWKPSGRPRQEDGDAVTEHIYRMLNSVFAPGELFYALFDYSELENPPVSNRLRVLKNLRDLAKRIYKVFFFGMNRQVRTIVRLSVQISGLSEKIFVEKNYEQTMQRIYKEMGKEGENQVSPLYRREEVQRLIEIMGRVVWDKDYDTPVPELEVEHPLSELYNAVEVMRYDLRMYDEQARCTRKELEEAQRQKDEVIADLLDKINELHELSSRSFYKSRPHKENTLPGGGDSSVYYFGNFLISNEGRDLRVNDKSVQLTPTEARILLVLLRNSGRYVASETILNEVWGDARPFDGPKALRVHIRRLRRKIEENPASPRYLVNRWGAGYMLQV